MSNPKTDGFTAWARHETSKFTDGDISSFELDRARHALAYLKDKLGNDAIRDLLADDVAQMTAEAKSWLDASKGEWRSKWIELIVTGPPAADFYRWYGQMFANDRQELLRAAHPEHFVNRSTGSASAEVIENVGETELPWRISYEPIDDADLPVGWQPDYPVRFASQLRDQNGVQIGFTLHEGRDDPDGMHLRMTTVLPVATPDLLFHHHLRHYAIELRNWTQFAWSELEAAGTKS